ncbi:MAG: 4Fe-4S binding protein [Proteobacteria bacterium]|nr:4Fe-4S binding protein [Pseudomonadota bacterium]
MGDAAKKKWRIEIDNKMCKGCSICVDFCPTKTLKIEGLYCSVQDLDKCTGCQLCDLRCPDFAIQVFPE